MKFHSFFVGLFFVSLSFSQGNELKGNYLDQSLASFHFISSELIVSDLEFGSGVFYGDYTVNQDTLSITKNPFLTKKNPCDNSLFCDKSKMETLKFLIASNTEYEFTLEAINVPAELFFESIYRREGFGIKEEKKYLKRKEIKSASEGSSMDQYLKKIHSRTFKKEDKKDVIQKFWSSSLRLEGNVKHYFDLEFDSTGYFVARDLYVEYGRDNAVNFYEGKLTDDEMQKMNTLYSKSFLAQIDPNKLPKRSGNDASLEFEFSIQNQKEQKVYKGYGSSIRVYMTPFVEFVQSSFRQTKYQKSNHHYNFIHSMFKE